MRCAGRVDSVWIGEHVRACVSHVVILVILLRIFGWAGVVTDAKSTGGDHSRRSRVW